MDRRSFLKSAAAVPLLLAPVMATSDAMPEIRYVSIPAKDTSKIDCCQSTGYFGGSITVRGQKYTALFSAPEREYLRRGREAVERGLRHHVDATLREVWLRAAH